MQCLSAASSVASADIPASPASVSESTGVWTSWMNNMNPYEEGQEGDLEITKNMDPVSSDQYWTYSMDGTLYIFV